MDENLTTFYTDVIKRGRVGSQNEFFGNQSSKILPKFNFCSN